MRSTRLVVTAALATVATLAFGSVASAGGALTKQEWRAEGNELCAAIEADTAAISDEVFGETPSNPSLEQMTEYVGRIEPLFTGLLDDLEDLKEPSSIKKPVKKMLATGRNEFEALVDDPSLGLEGNPIARFSARAKKLGLADCS